MTADLAKLCRVGKDRERPSVVFSHHLTGQDSIIACARCGYPFAGQSIRDGIARSKADAERRAR